MAKSDGPKRIPATQARDDLGNIVNRVAFGGERIVLERRGSDVAAIVSMDDLRRLEEFEDEYWTVQAEKALADAKRRRERPVPFEKIERQIDARRRTARSGARRRRSRTAR